MKHKLFVRLFVAAVLIVMAAFFLGPVLAVHAAPIALAGPSPATILDIAVKIMLGFVSLVGVSQLIAALINLLKLFGLVKDGTAAMWSAGLNLAAFIGLVLLGVFRPDMTVEILDGYAGQIASVLLFVLGFLTQIVGSQAAHKAFSNAHVPLIGKSYSKSG